MSCSHSTVMVMLDGREFRDSSDDAIISTNNVCPFLRKGFICSHSNLLRFMVTAPLWLENANLVFNFAICKQNRKFIVLYDS